MLQVCDCVAPPPHVKAVTLSAHVHVRLYSYRERCGLSQSHTHSHRPPACHAVRYCETQIAPLPRPHSCAQPHRQESDPHTHTTLTPLCACSPHSSADPCAHCENC